MTSALDSYLGWDLLTHRPGCARPSWTVDVRTTHDEFRSRHGGPVHDCQNGECGHGDKYTSTTVRIVCTSCGLTETITGETGTGDTGRSTGSTRDLGYGLAPRRVAGLHLYPGEPHDFVVTVARVDRVTTADVVGQITQTLGRRGGVQWSATAVPAPDGRFGLGHIRWAHAQDGHRTVAAAAKWIYARVVDSAEEKDTPAGAEFTPQAPATVEFSDGTVALTDWSLTNLPPDFYGRVFRELGGWLTDWVPGTISLGTNHMLRATLPGASPHAHNVNVQLTTVRHDDGRTFLSVQWLHETPASGVRPIGGGS